VAVSEANQRHALIAIARKQVGVKEHPLGSNRGPEVDAYNRSAATDMGAPWCAAVKVWCHTEIGLPCRGNAYSPSWFVKAWVTLTPQPGDYALVYFPKMGRFAHTIVVIESAKYSGSRCVEVVTLEGNTNAQGSREGDQFARRNRRFDSVTCLRFQPAVSAAAL
jgi:hypothetical protein